MIQINKSTRKSNKLRRALSAAIYTFKLAIFSENYIMISLTNEKGEDDGIATHIRLNIYNWFKPDFDFLIYENLLQRIFNNHYQEIRPQIEEEWSQLTSAEKENHPLSAAMSLYEKMRCENE